MPTTLLSDYRTFLIAQGVGRMPSPVTAETPIIVDPLKGTPYIDEIPETQGGVTAVIALYEVGGIASGAFEAWLERPRVDVRVRAEKGPRAREVARQVRQATLGISSAPAVAFQMGSRDMISAEEWSPVQPIRPFTQGAFWTWGVLFHTRFPE